MKQLKLLLIPAAVWMCVGLGACDKNKSRFTETKEGTWDFTAGDYSVSYRNHWYTFTKTNDDSLKVILEAQNEDARIWLHKGNDFNIYEDYSNPYHWSPTVKIAGTYDDDDYTLIVGTMVRGETDSYDLTIEGAIENLQKLGSTNLTSPDGAKIQFGGGGLRYYENPLSLRNERYSFEVLENNTPVDIHVVCEEEDIRFYVFDGLDLWIESWNEVDKEQDLIVELDEGIHYLYVCTKDLGVPEVEYSINMNGQVGNLSRIKPVSEEDDFTISEGGGNNIDSPQNITFDFTVTENNSTLDVICSSRDFEPMFWFRDEFGAVSGPYYEDKEFGRLLPDIDEGDYSIVCGTRYAGESGTFNFSVVGMISDFRESD